MSCTKSDGTIVTVTYKLFKANCPAVNQLCSGTSTAYVAAITVCNQALF